MFKRFKKPKQAVIICPYCGNQQEEPQMAMSTYCRKCGEHLRLKDGEVISQDGPRISGITVIEPEPSKEEKEEATKDEVVTSSSKNESKPEKEASVDAWLRSAGEDKAKSLKADEPDDEVLEEQGAGAFFGLVEDKGSVAKKQPEKKAQEKKKNPKKDKKKPSNKKSKEKASTETDKSKDSEDSSASDVKSEEEEDEKSLGAEAQSKESLSEGSMGALIGNLGGRNETESEPAKMPADHLPPEAKARKKKREKRESSTQMEVRCFRCNHMQTVTRYATSTQCGRCSVYISMSDYEVKGVRKNVLRTRGNVVVSRRGSVVDTEIACHDLTIHGKYSARVDATGTVNLRNSGVVQGQLNCRKLMIDRKCEVEFPDGVVCETAEILGTLKGNLTCEDKAVVRRTGIVDGDVTAAEIEIREGGEVSGETEISDDIDVTLPIRAGYNPSAID